VEEAGRIEKIHKERQNLISRLEQLSMAKIQVTVK
jgi:hypothetical protein